ncbi:Uncharacterised protein [Acinetobacter baumannii]|nr:Uncharacterised protein [Acinetobacter baumannii]
MAVESAEQHRDVGETDQWPRRGRLQAPPVQARQQPAAAVAAAQAPDRGDVRHVEGVVQVFQALLDRPGEVAVAGFDVAAEMVVHTVHFQLPQGRLQHVGGDGRGWRDQRHPAVDGLPGLVGGGTRGHAAIP